MSFSTLPVELTQRIIRFTIPDSFRNTAATCKLFYRASRFLVDEYKKTVRFRHFRYSNHFSGIYSICRAEKQPGGAYLNCKNPKHWDEATVVSGMKIVNAVGLLQAISCEPDISWYIQSLDLKDPDKRLDQPEHLVIPSSFWGDMKAIQSLARLYRTAVPLAEETVEEDINLWLGSMTGFLADVFILNLLPNVKEIALSKSWGRVEIVNETNLNLLDAMIGRANDPAVRDAPLARLAVVKPYIGHGGSAQACFNPLASFLALNSVREFYMGGVQAFSDDDTGISFIPRHAVYGNSLRTIELNGSAIGPRALTNLLSRTPQLECLRLGLESKASALSHQYNIGHLIALISAQVGGSLKELAIHTNPYETDTYTLANMHGFTRLQILELDIDSLCGPPCSPAVLPSGRLDEHFPTFPMGVRPTLPRLVDLLPPSLVSFQLRFSTILQRIPSYESEFVFFRLPEMLIGFRDERSSKLPCLSHVIFIPPYDVERYSRGNEDRAFGNSINSIVRHVEASGIRWDRTAVSCDSTFNERFGVKDAAED